MSIMPSRVSVPGSQWVSFSSPWAWVQVTWPEVCSLTTSCWASWRSPATCCVCWWSGRKGWAAGTRPSYSSLLPDWRALPVCLSCWMGVGYVEVWTKWPTFSDDRFSCGFLICYFFILIQTSLNLFQKVQWFSIGSGIDLGPNTR